jgi:hypothetical protein
MNRVIGAIYPIPLEFTDGLFNGKIKVFVKYVPHNTTRLVPKHKVVFYASHGPKALIGEGTIEKVEFLQPETVIKKYRTELFLNETEFYKYVKRTPSRALSREIMVIVFKKLARYRKPINYDKHMTMTGHYLDIEEYSSLRDRTDARARSTSTL